MTVVRLVSRLSSKDVPFQVPDTLRSLRSCNLLTYSLLYRRTRVCTKIYRRYVSW